MGDIQLFILEHETALRLCSFVLLLVLLLGAERFRPRRAPRTNQIRMGNNLFLLLINYLALRLLIPLATFEMALFAEGKGFGLFNMVDLPVYVDVILTLVVFDLLIYLQHVFFHHFRFFWRVHRVHHTDLEVDVTTGVRFHPLEMIMSMCYKLFAVFLLGPVAFAIVLYEILLNSASLFTHSNILLPGKLDKYLRAVFVTPDMHRIHHSALRKETDSNYGNFLSVWDRLFRTYRATPDTGYDNMIIGLNEFRDPSSAKIIQLLKNPFIAYNSR